MTGPALFAAAHPDDETLMACVAIAEHLRAGQDVHVLWLTGGDASGVISVLNGSAGSSWWGVPHDPPAEGYTPLTAAELAAARIREATAAVRLLGSGYTGTLTLHAAGLPDGAVTPAAAEAAIVAVADQIAPGGPVRIKTHSHVVDDHPDHQAAGLSAQALKTADPARFGDLRQYILPGYWMDPRLAQVTESWDNPADAGVIARCRTACRAFAAWSPPHTYAVGYHSVPTKFALIEASPRSMVHP